MEYTSYLNLKKPQYDETSDIKDLNDNAEIIDTAIRDMCKRIYPVGSIYMSVSSTDPSTLFYGTTWTRLKDRFLLGAGDTYAAGGTGGAASRSYTPGGTIGGHAITESELPSHSHGLNSHTHTIGSHLHGLNNHVHSVGPHVHGLNDHVHGYGQGVMFIEKVTETGTYTYLQQGGGYGWAPGASDAITTQASGNTANSTAFDTSAASGNTAYSSAFESGTASGNTAATGSGNAHVHSFTGTSATIDTMPPYLTVYMWKRTA